MGNLARKLKRANKPAVKPSVPVSKEQFDLVYSMIKGKMTAEVYDKVREHIMPIMREQLKEEIRQEVAGEITQEAYAKFLAVTCNILMNDFGKLKTKDTRLKVYYEKLQEYAGDIENPSEQQLAAEKALAEQVDGINVVR